MRHRSHSETKWIWLFYVIAAVASLIIWHYYKFIDITPGKYHQSVAFGSVFLFVLFLIVKFLISYLRKVIRVMQFINKYKL